MPTKKKSDKKKKNQEEDFVIPEWHKEIVRERIKTSKPEDQIPWKKVLKQLMSKK